MRPRAPAGGLTVLPYYLAPSIGHRAGVTSLTQNIFTASLPRSAGGEGLGRGINR